MSQYRYPQDHPDRKVGRPCAWEITANDTEVIRGWYIYDPFDTGIDAKLMCHAIRGNGKDGGYIGLAIRDFAEIDTSQMNVQRQSRRARRWFEAEW